MPVFVVMLGAPGAGKGTQSELLSKAMGLPHVSSGNIFRENIKNQTELGKLVKDYLDRGDLVPDDVTIAMIKDRVSRPDCENGALLDGFPRTVAQAKALDVKLAELNGRVGVVPYIHVSEEALVRRLSGRYTCQAEGHIFHQTFNPPKEAGICDFDGSELYQREDDKVETVENRIQVYMKQTEPLVEYYRSAGVLVEVDGEQDINNVTKELIAVMRSMEEL
jgi:adenylate kinase